MIVVTISTSVPTLVLVSKSAQTLHIWELSHWTIEIVFPYVSKCIDNACLDWYCLRGGGVGLVNKKTKLKTLVYVSSFYVFRVCATFHCI